MEDIVFEYIGTKLRVRLNSSIEKLVVPEIINGTVVNNLGEIEVETKEYIDKIKHLVLPKTLRFMGKNIAMHLTSLKEVDILSDNLKIEAGAYIIFNNIEKMYIKDIDMNSLIIDGNKALREATFGNQPKCCRYRAFADCENLEKVNIFGEGLIKIGGYSFQNCNKITDVTFPKSLRDISFTIFRHCKNLKTLRITGKTIISDYNSVSAEMKETLVMGRRASIRSRYTDGEVTKLLDKSNGTIIYCPYDYPYKALEKCIGEKITVVREGIEDKRLCKQYEEKILKARLFGYNINEYDIAKGRVEMISSLKIIGNNMVRDQIIDYLKSIIPYLKETHEVGSMIGAYGAYIGIRIYSGQSYLEALKFKGLKILNKYAVGLFRGYIYIWAIDLDLIIQYLESETGKKECNELSMWLYIPVYVEKGIDVTSIIDISEVNDKLVIKLKDDELIFGIDNLDCGIY